MLNTYLSRTQALLQNPPATPALYTDALLTGFINQARGQVAGEAECVRAVGTLNTNVGQYIYQFNAITVDGPAVAAIQGVINVRTVWYSVGTGQKWMRPRPFEWFSLYELNSAVARSGPPESWAQYGQGAQARPTPNPIGGGSIYIAPQPDIRYVLTTDCVCFPIDLVDDTTPEAIPFLWTDAVPYFAAYLALLSSQTGARMAAAEKYLQVYAEFVARARRASTPSVLPTQYAQVPSPVRQNQLGVAGGAGGGGARAA